MVRRFRRMDGAETVKLDPKTLARQRGLSTQLLHSSRAAGWSTTLIEHRRCVERSRALELTPTADLNLVLQIEGRVRMESPRQGRWTSADFMPGAMGMTAAGRDARFRQTSSAPFEQIHLFVPGNVLSEAAERLRRAGTRSSLETLDRFRMRDPVVAEAMRAMVAASRRHLPDLYAEEAIAWLAMHLLSVHGNVDRNDDREMSQGLDRRLARALALIHQSFDLPLSLSVLAAEAGISKFHFSKLFKQHTGKSPHRYLEDVRMAEARRLLLDTDQPIADVASSCGYPQAANFTTAFRRQHSEAPTSYRAMRPQFTDDTSAKARITGSLLSGIELQHAND